LKISARTGLRLPERDLKQRRDFLQHRLHASTDRPQALANHLVTACSSPADGAGNHTRENALRHFIPGNKISNLLANCLRLPAWSRALPNQQKSTRH
jgi:hypothetical protein